MDAGGAMNGRTVAKFYSKVGTFNLVVENFFLDFNSSSSPIANSRAAARLQCAVPPARTCIPYETGSQRALATLPYPSFRHLGQR